MPHALGLAGRSRRVDHVGQAGAGHAGRWRRRRGRGQARLLAVEAEEPRLALGRHVPQRGGRHQNRSAHVADLVGEPGRRRLRVERHVGAARLPHRQQGHHQIQASAQADGHRHFGTDALFAQDVGQPVRTGVQLRVGQGAAVADQGDRVRPGRRLPLQRLQQGEGRRRGQRRRLLAGACSIRCTSCARSCADRSVSSPRGTSASPASPDNRVSAWASIRSTVGASTRRASKRMRISRPAAGETCTVTG